MFFNSHLQGPGVAVSEISREYSIGTFTSVGDTACMSGYGCRMTAEKTFEKGHFKDSLLHGYGVRKTPNTLEKGLFIKGKLIDGQYKFESGENTTEYQGRFINGENGLPRLNGQGTMESIITTTLGEHKLIYKGNFKEGQLHGDVCCTSEDDSKYHCNVFNGEKTYWEKTSGHGVASGTIGQFSYDNQFVALADQDAAKAAKAEQDGPKLNLNHAQHVVVGGASSDDIVDYSNVTGITNRQSRTETSEKAVEPVIMPLTASVQSVNDSAVSVNTDNADLKVDN